MSLTDKQKALAWERLYRAEARGKISKTQKVVRIDTRDWSPKLIDITTKKPNYDTYKVATFWRDPDGEWQLV